MKMGRAKIKSVGVVESSLQMASSEEGCTDERPKRVKVNHLFDALLWRAEEHILHEVPPAELQRPLVRKAQMRKFEHDVVCERLQLRVDFKLKQRHEQKPKQRQKTLVNAKGKRVVDPPTTYDLRKRRKVSEFQEVNTSGTVSVLGRNAA